MGNRSLGFGILWALLAAVWLACAASVQAGVAGRFHVSGPGGTASLGGGLGLALDWRDGRVAGADVRLADWDLDLPWARGRGSVRAVLALDGGVVRVRSLRVDMAELAARVGDAWVGPMRLLAEAGDVVVRDGGGMEVDRVSISVPGVLGCSGSLAVDRAGAARARLSGRVIDLSGLAGLLEPVLPQAAALRGVRGEAEFSLASGPEGMELELRPFLAGLEWAGGNATLRIGPGGVRAEARALGVRLDSVAGLVQALTGVSLADWSLSGTADLEARLGLEGWGARLDLDQVAFLSPDARVLADKGRLSLAVDAPPGNGTVRAALAVDKGEVVLGAAYVNLGDFPLRADLALRPGQDSGPGRLELDAEWTGFGRARAVGRADLSGRGPLYAGRVSVADVDLSRLYKARMADPTAQPGAGSGLAGQVEAEADVAVRPGSQGGGVDLDGRLRATGVSFQGPDQGVEVQGLDLDLPFVHRLGGPPAPAEPPREWGRLRVGDARLPMARIHGLSLGVAVAPDRLYTDGEARVDVLGGRLRLSGLRVDRPLSGDFRAELSADLEGLDLARVPSGGVALEGGLEGSLPAVVLTRDRLEAGGALRGTLFGGGLKLRELAVDNPLLPSRTVRADLTVRGLDQERLSRALGVGRVTGRLDVDLEDLAVAYGQPVSFRLRAESVARRGVEQVISLKAVNSIAIMGTGSGLTGLGVSLLASFFKELPYRAMGFSCALENDVFRVRGLINRGGVEYLVLKPLLSGINVVNGNPDNRISFSDMLERMKRVVRPDRGKGAKE